MFETSSVVTASADSRSSNLVKRDSGERFIGIDPGSSCGRDRYLTERSFFRNIGTLAVLLTVLMVLHVVMLYFALYFAF
jgi:hypothetical protein